MYDNFIRKIKKSHFHTFSKQKWCFMYFFWKSQNHVQMVCFMKLMSSTYFKIFFFFHKKIIRTCLGDINVWFTYVHLQGKLDFNNIMKKMFMMIVNLVIIKICVCIRRIINLWVWQKMLKNAFSFVISCECRFLKL